MSHCPTCRDDHAPNPCGSCDDHAELLKEVLRAWDSLPGGQRMVRKVEQWLNDDMAPVIANVRKALGVRG